MQNLSMFLNPVKEENAKMAVSNRFVDEEGKPIQWELKSITSTEDEAIRKKYTKMVQVKGKHGQYTQDFDVNGYLAALAVACTVYPNLNDSQLQDGYGVMGAEQLLKSMLKPGEFAQYSAKVQEINGYDTSLNELVEEAKN